VTTREALAYGITPDQLRARRITRLTRSVYLREGNREEFQITVEAALAASGAEAALCAQSALRWLGVDVPSSAEDGKVHILLGRGCRGSRLPWIQAHRPVIQPEVAVSNGLPVVVPGDAWMQAAARSGVTDLVVMADSLMCRKNPIMSKALLGEYVGQWRGRGRQGYDRARQAYELAEPGTDSPPETRLRLVLVRYGLKQPAVNLRVRTPWGYFLLDLGYAAEKVGIEYDGAVHVGDVRQMEHDHRRRRWLEDHGWRVITVTAADLANDPEGIVASVQLAVVTHRVN